MVYYLTEDNKVQVKYKIVDFNRFTSHYLTDFNKAGLDFALKAKYGEIMIDTSNDKAIGYVLVNKAGTIGPIKVYEKYRGHGYSKVLLRDAIDKYHGYKLGVMKDNTVAINLYKSFGFKVVKETKDHYNIELEKSIHESEDKSTLTKDYKKGKLNLSDFHLQVAHYRRDGRPVKLYWTDDDANKVAVVLTDTQPAVDGYRWFGSLEIYSIYRGYGLVDQIMDLVVNKYKAGALAVHKDNEVAIKLYKKHGFEISTTRTDKEYYYMYLKKNQVKSAIKESTDSRPISGSLFLTENTDDNDDSILDEIKKFNKLLNSYKYGIPKNGKIGNTSAEDFYKNYRLESIQEFEKNKGGVCWDFVYYEDYYFKKNFKGVPTKLFYIIIDDNKNCPTHTFLTFSYKGKYYWFESSWSKYSGVHEYNSESELTKDVCKKHNMYNTGDYPMYMRSFKSSEVRPGMNTKEYMDVMNKGLKKVNI